MAVHTLVFSASSAGGITPYNSNVVNGETESMSFQYSSGDYPTAGAELKRIHLDMTHVKVYSTHDPYLSCAYGDFYLGAASDDTHAISADFVNASRSILSFSGGSIPFTVCSGTAANVGILNIRSSCTATLTIEWEPRTASTGVLSSTTGVQGKNISLSIRSIDSTFTHYVTWYRDNTQYQNQNIAAGTTTATFTVPTSWPVGSAVVYLTTYYGNQIVGSTQAYNWTIVVDGDTTYPTAGTLAVTLTQHSAVPASWGVYVQGYSSAQLTLTGYSAGNTASISNITLKLGSLSKSGTSNIYATPALTETGRLESSAIVTNSFGNSASVSGPSVPVYYYESPKINSILAYRCLSDGVANDYGTYIAVTTNVYYSLVNNKNAIVTLQCQWRVKDTGSWSNGVNISNGSTTIINAGLAANATIYEIRVVLIDTIQSNLGTSTTKTSIVLTSECIVFFKDGGLNVSIGMQGEKNNAIEINENWQIWKGQTRLDGTVQIDRGGTGATTVPGARNALGLGNTDGPVPIANGGTGANTKAGARKNLGLGETEGALPIENGGTASTSAAGARTALGITPANIGAAASNHSHALSALGGAITLSQLPFKIAYGKGVQINQNTGVYINYSSAGFTSAPTIVATYSTTGTNVAGSAGPIKFYSVGTSGAYCIIGGSGTARDIDWIAIGT